MGIRNWIAEQKDAHQRYRLSAMKADTSAKQVSILELEKQREKQLAFEKSSQKELALKREIESSQMRVKEQQGPSKAQKFGRGLASVMNKAKTGIKEHKAQVAKKGGGLSIGAPQSYGSRGLGTGSRNVFGGASRDVFSGPTSEPKKEKPRVTIVVR